MAENPHRRLEPDAMSSLANERIAYFNGRYVPESEVRVPFRDRSWLYGDGAFDMTRTFNGRVFKIEEHIERALPLAEVSAHRSGTVAGRHDRDQRVRERAQPPSAGDRLGFRERAGNNPWL